MFSKTFLLLFCVFYSYQLNDKNCGLKKSNKFIIGGKDTKTHEFPFIVSILYLGGHSCGGTLITNRYVLTAAHCVINKRPQNIKILIGTNNNKWRIWRSKSYTVRVNQFIINGCYNIKSYADSDIALIKLEHEIQMDDTIATICLPPKDAEPINSDITIAGWGVWVEKIPTSSSDRPNILQKAQVQLYPIEYCLIYNYFPYLGGKQFLYLGNKICLQSDTSTGCWGDSGGPAFQEVFGKWYQIGITSYGYAGIFPGLNWCVKSAPVTYTKVSYYSDWIKDMIKMDSKEEIIESAC